MVYISHSSTDLTSSPSLSNVPWTQDASTKDVLLGVCVTVAGVFTLCILLTFTSCCCRRRKSSEDEDVSEDAEDREKGQVLNNKRKDPLKKAPSSSGLDSPTEGSTSLSKQLDIRKSCPNFQDVDSNSLSVKDRIKAFEFFQNDQDVKLREGSKPKRKKPTSKAFDDFESQGILIGFGGNRRKTTSTEGLTPDPEEELKDYHQLPPIPLQHLHQQQDRLANQQQTEEKKGLSDEFEAVQRDTDILKSFRRAPPPKNRTRARRSGRRRPQGASDGVGIITEDQENEEKEFESSLHMQPSTPQSNARTTVKAIDRLGKNTPDSLLNRSFRSSPQSQRSSLRSQRETAVSHQSDLDFNSRKENELTVDFNKDFDMASTIRSRSFSEGLSNNTNKTSSIQQKQSVTKNPLYPPPQTDPFKYSLNPANVTLSSLRRDLPIGKKTDFSHNDHNSSDHKSATDNWSPQPQRPVSVGGAPMRRWASDHNPSSIPQEVPRPPLLDVQTWMTHDTSNKDTTNTDTSGRKFRFDEGEQERIYPKSEKLLRKAIGSITGNCTPPPNLLYRPYYHTSDNTNQEPQVSNGHRQYQRTRSESWGGNPNSMIVHFNIDTEPTNV